MRESRLVVAKSIDPVDSLEISKRNGNSDSSCVELSIVLYSTGINYSIVYCYLIHKIDGGDDNDNSNEDTDTEFEDDLIVTAILNNSSAEETRMSLENALGAKEFIKAYPLIEVLGLIVLV